MIHDGSSKVPALLDDKILVVVAAQAGPTTAECKARNPKIHHQITLRREFGKMAALM
jgi:hypothetical protein